MSDLWTGNSALDKLRSRAAGTATGFTSTSIEELNDVGNQLRAQLAAERAIKAELVKALETQSNYYAALRHGIRHSNKEIEINNNARAALARASK